MATRSASGRASGSTATKDVPGNQTPNTPNVNESEIARLKVDQLRDRLRRRGITGTADMRKDELVDALIKALREGRRTTRSRNSSGTGPQSGRGSRSQGGSRSGSGERPGNQTPNTPNVNESEIARLKVDQLRDRLRRRGITGTADMRKDELVDALIKALREGRRTTRSRNSSGTGPQSGRGSRSRSGPGSGGASGSGRGAGSGRGSGSGSRGVGTDGSVASDSPRAAALADLERRAAELADVTPQAPEVEDVERRAAELEAAMADRTALPVPPAPDTPALPATPDDAKARRSEPNDTGPPGPARVPRSRGATGDQSVRTRDEPVGSGPDVTMETADRVLTSMVPAEMDPVDEIVTPEGTVLTAGSDSADTAVATPPLPGTDGRHSSPR
ncbi:hypothetical protein [Micromonospora sp. NPDC049799]|uniref:hypothetical protein n=1 Tax=Micromonospora sp. NPDC049799 TaxID=3154741 RepID=UPI0033E26178